MDNTAIFEVLKTRSDREVSTKDTKGHEKEEGDWEGEVREIRERTRKEEGELGRLVGMHSVSHLQ